MKQVFLYAFIVLLAAAPAQAAGGVTVLELFTSQGCSSCPAADRALEGVAGKPGVIALSCHVTYWDRLGWKDTLGHEFCTARQNEYAYKLGGAGNIYTPQMIANGSAEFVGSHEGDITAALDQKIPAIDTAWEGQSLKLSLPALANRDAQAITLVLLAYEKSHAQDIAGGENGGAHIRYTNAVTSMMPVGSWNGAAETRLIQMDKPAGPGLGYALLAEDEATGHIMAAGKIEP